MSNTLVFEIEVFRSGTEILIKKIHLMAYNLFQATHLAFEYIHDEDSEFQNEDVELGSVRKMPGINNIINPEFILDMMDEGDENEYNGSEPIEIAKELPDESTIKFSCECHEELRVVDSNWPFVKCPNCENKIFRNELKTFGGITVYEKSNK